MKLYYSKGACSLAVRIILNEMGIAADYDAVDMKTKQTVGGDNFFALNPKGAVPTLRLENGDILTENAVIMQYLADHYQASNLLPPVGQWQRYRVLEWMNYVSTELHKGFSPLFHPKVSTETKAEIFIPNLMYKLQYVADRLQDQTYLMGTHFTLPDAYLFVILRWAASMNVPIDSLPRLTHYQAQLRLRKSIMDALQQEGLKQ